MKNDIFEIIKVDKSDTELYVAVDVESEDADDPDSRGFIGDEGVTIEDS